MKRQRLNKSDSGTQFADLASGGHSAHNNQPGGSFRVSVRLSGVSRRGRALCGCPKPPDGLESEKTYLFWGRLGAGLETWRAFLAT